MALSEQSSCVLHTITGLEVGGAEFMLLRYLGALDHRAWPSKVLSLMPPGRLQPQAEQMNVAVSNLNTAPGAGALFKLPALGREIARLDPFLLHGWMYHGNLAASLAAAQLRGARPVIWSIHHSLADIKREKLMTHAIIRALAFHSKSAAAISYCSKISAAQHEAVGFADAHRHVIPNGTDCDVFKPDPDAGARLRAMLCIPGERRIIGHVGRLHPMKDQTRIVDAIRLLLDRGYDAQGLFIGAGHVDGAVRARARALNIDERIATFDVREDIARLAPGFDLFVLSSSWGEAFSLAVAEAMASGTPAVVTDVGDCSWLVGDTGAVSPPNDTEGLASACAKILDLDSAAIRRLGDAARRRIIEKFALKEYVRRHVALYEQALGSPLRGAVIA